MTRRWIPPDVSIEMAAPVKRRLNASTQDNRVWRVQLAPLDSPPPRMIAVGGCAQPLSISKLVASMQLIVELEHPT